MEWIVGIDLSLKSPGITIFNSVTHKWLLYGFSQTQKIRNPWISPNGDVRIYILPKIPGTSSSDIVRYDYISKSIVSILPKHKDKTIIYLEDYAYVNSRIAGSSFKLHELGGILKYTLFNNHYSNVMIISHCKWKKVVCKSGKISKQQMVEFVQYNGPQIDLWDIFGLVYDLKSVPTPIQDIADSVGIAMYHNFYNCNDPIVVQKEMTTKKRNRMVKDLK